jgi:hypothetical protein
MHTRKDTLTKPNSGTSWWKHARKWGKRIQSKMERQAAKKNINEQVH